MTGAEPPSTAQTLPERLGPGRAMVGRLVVGGLLDMGIRAYGAAAALSVAMSDAETVGGKARDAVAAVPNLADKYRQAEYVVEHREEIQASIDYLNEHTPPQAELQQAADEGTRTLRDIEGTYSDVVEAQEAASRAGFLDAAGHIRDAWSGRPDLESIRNLADLAEQVSPLADEVQVLTPVYYGGLLAVTDNFASDEIVGTLFVMGVALLLASLLGQTVGFWIRRGRPGFIAHALQALGARAFRPWYVAHLPYVLGPRLHAVARERIVADIVADPERVLDPEALRRLERHFASRAADDAGPGDGQAP